MAYKQHHDKRTIIHGTGQMFAARGAETEAAAIAAGLEDFQLIDEIGITTRADIREKMVTLRGQRRLGKASSKMTEESYTVTLGQLGFRNTAMLYNANPDRDWGSEAADNIQTGLSAVAGSAWDFDESSDGVANVAGRWYPVLNSSGVRVKDITALSLAGTLSAYGAAADGTALAEGIDYKLDGKLGMVQFLRAIDDDVITPTITSKTITAADKEYLKKLVPGERAFIEGMFCIYFWDDDDDDNLALCHEYFLGRLSPNTGPSFNDEYVTVQANLKVLEEGRVLARPDGDY